MMPYDFEFFEIPFYKGLAEHACAMSILKHRTSVERVSVCRLSAKETLPFVFRCRAQEPFKKGQLVLVPALWEIMYIEHDDAAVPTKKTVTTIHESMLSQAIVCVRGGTKDKRLKSKANSTMKSFVMRSPLLDAKAQKNREVCMETLNPFWAVLRCVGPKAASNMQCSSEVLVYPEINFKVPRFRA